MHLAVEIAIVGLLFRIADSQGTSTTTPTSTTTTTVTTPTSTTTLPTTTTTVTTPTSTTTTTGSSTTTTTGSSTSTTTRPSTTTVTGSSTTTTAPSTTTTIAEPAPTEAQLWSVNFYYNWLFGTHAFCAEQACVDSIQANGIGYDLIYGKGVLGKAVSESSIAAVRAACPIGSQNLRNLGFTKSGLHYVHTLDGTGLKQGWVSTVNGACGAKIPIKRWKSRFTDDMMYTVNLDWNTWYNGMVQDGGQVLFYMWE